MSFVYNHFKDRLGAAAINLTAGNVRLIILLAGTSAATEDDVTSLGGFTALKEFDGSGYTQATGTTLANQVWAKNAALNRSELDADDVTYTGLGVPTGQVAALLLLYWTGTFAGSVPLGYLDTPPLPVTFAGAANTLFVVWSTSGILHLA
jgi:hypothetical protein